MVSQNVRKEKTTAAIMSAARTHFGAKGYTATSLNDIVASAGITKGALYHHFQSKRNLFEAVLVAESNMVANSTMELLQTEGDYFEIVELALHRFFNQCRDETMVRIIFSDGPSVLGDEKWRQIDHKNFGGQIMGVLAIGMQNEIIKEFHLDSLTSIFISTINESVLQCTRAESFTETAHKYVNTIMFLLRGISVKR